MTSGRSDSQTFLAAALALAATILVIYGTGLCVRWGINIPQEDLRTDYLLGATWAFALALTIPFWPVPIADREMLKWAWLGKCGVTLILMLPYEAHYDLDEFGYFFQSRLSDYVWNSSEAKRGHQAVVWVAWVQERFIDSFHAAKVSYSMIGLVAIYFFYRALGSMMREERREIFYWIAFLPSIIFWSSILGKDPIVFLGVAVYFFGVVRLRGTGSPFYVLVVAAGIIIASFIRYWLGIILMVPLMIFAVIGLRSMFARLAFAVIAVGGFVYVLSQFASGMGIASVDELPTLTGDIAARWQAHATTDVRSDFSSLGLMVAFLPVGIFTVMFRPLPGEVLSAFGLFAGAENLVLLGGAWLAVKRIRIAAVRRKIIREPILIWAMALMFIWAAVYGFVSVQNLGAAVRFRLPVLAVMIGVSFMIRRVALAVRPPVRERPAAQQPVRPVLVAAHEREAAS